jgi:pSer/pThr/pTyr-binding forkhead associated (FHA) protein
VVVRVPGSEELSLQISRRHLEIQRIGQEFFVIDRSRGHTKLNGKRLREDQPQAIHSGDRLKIGRVLTIEVQIHARSHGADGAKFLQVPGAHDHPGGLTFEATIGDMVTEALDD